MPRHPIPRRPTRLPAATKTRPVDGGADRSTGAVRDSLAVGLATAAYGISFGALSVAAGLDIWQTCFLSLVMFTGGSQFALVGVLASGGVAAGGSAIATAAMLGIRNVVYGMRMKPIVDRGGLWRGASPPPGSRSTSRPRSRSRSPSDRAARVGFWVTGVVIFVGWNLTTLAGALIGDALGDTRAWGLDAAAAAAFLGLLWPRLKRFQAGAVAVGAAVVATLTTPVLMPGLPVLVAAVVAVVVGWFDLVRTAGARHDHLAHHPHRVGGDARAEARRATSCPPGSSSASVRRASPTCSRSRCSPRSSPCRRSAPGQAIVIDARVPARHRRGRPLRAAGAVHRRRDRRGAVAAGIRAFT